MGPNPIHPASQHCKPLSRQRPIVQIPLKKLTAQPRGPLEEPLKYINSQNVTKKWPHSPDVALSLCIHICICVCVYIYILYRSTFTGPLQFPKLQGARRYLPCKGRGRGPAPVGSRGAVRGRRKLRGSSIFLQTWLSSVRVYMYIHIYTYYAPTLRDIHMPHVYIYVYIYMYIEYTYIHT